MDLRHLRLESFTEIWLDLNDLIGTMTVVGSTIANHGKAFLYFVGIRFDVRVRDADLVTCKASCL
jgi:hypothetical protein